MLNLKSLSVCSRHFHCDVLSRSATERHHRKALQIKAFETEGPLTDFACQFRRIVSSLFRVWFPAIEATRAKSAEVVVVSSRRVRKGPGRRPQSAKRQQFLKLLAQDWILAATRREVGVSRSTGQLAGWSRGAPQRRHSTLRASPGPLDYPSDFVTIPLRAERIEITDRREAGETTRAIAAKIGRSPSTVSRELRRNVATAGRVPPVRSPSLRRDTTATGHQNS